MKQKLVLLTALCLTLVLSQAAFSAGLVKAVEIEKEDGYVGLHIKNDHSIGLDTDYRQTNTSSIKYYIDGEETYILTNKSAGNVPAGATKFVVLNKSWPESGYYKLNVTFADDQSVIYPTHDTDIIFSKQGLSKIETEVIPGRITLDDDVTLNVKIKATGENDVSNIGIKDKENPSFFTYSSKDIPSSMNQGKTKEFTFKYEPSGGSMADTVIYQTVHPLVNISYSYLGFDTVLELNESVVVFNKYKVGNDLPNVSTWLEMPEEIKTGTKQNISVYAQNKNADGHSACSVNLTLSTDNSDINVLPADTEISSANKTSTHTIITAEKLFGTNVKPVTPFVKFEIEVPEGAKLGGTTFTLEGNYKDCEWQAPLKIEEVTGSTEIVTELSEPEENETNETEANQTTEENQTNVSEENTTESEKETGTEDKKESFGTKEPVKFYLILGLAAFFILVLVVLALEWRSRFI